MATTGVAVAINSYMRITSPPTNEHGAVELPLVLTPRAIMPLPVPPQVLAGAG
jgi:hypothetical protein